MLTRKIGTIASVATMAITLSQVAQAENFATFASLQLLRPSVIYGTDNRQDLYQVNNPLYRSLAQATGALFKNDKIKIEGESAKILSSPFGPSMGLCESEPFYTQPAGAFCSGSLVGPDLFLTAGHCLKSQFDCEQTSFVFDFALKDNDDYLLELPKGKVYGCKDLVTTFRDDDGADYALVRLDRTVDGIVPLAINRNTTVQVGAPIVVIGHPSGLPTKVTDGAQVRNIKDAYFQTNLDTYGGNSGSAVFNAQTGLVEGILVRGENDFVYQDGCRVSNQCDENGCRGEDVTLIEKVASFIPDYNLL